MVHDVHDGTLFSTWFINPTFLRQSCLYQHCESDKQYMYGEIVTITESNVMCCIIFLFGKKTGNASLHFETNKHMQCIFAIAFLKHAMDLIVKYTNLTETYRRMEQTFLFSQPDVAILTL